MRYLLNATLAGELRASKRTADLTDLKLKTVVGPRTPLKTVVRRITTWTKYLKT